MDEEMQKGNVIAIAEKGQAAQTQKNAAWAKSELRKALNGIGYFPLPVRFRVIRQEDGTRIRYLEYPDGHMVFDRSDEGMSVLAKWCYTRAETEKAFNLSKDDVKKILEMWQLSTDPIDMPDIIKFKSDEGRCLRRLPFDISHGETPLFDDIMGRMTNRKAVMAYIWSIFEARSYNQQFLWVQGEGRDGKGALGRWFERILTMANFVSMHELPRKMEYLSHLLIGKRLAFISDNRDRNLATKSLFISITGGDLQLAENKYISSFMTRLACKFIIMSNPDPNVTREKSVLRRLIFARIAAPKEIKLTHTQYEDGLYSESGAFLAKCRDVYLELCPNHEEIKSDETAVTELIDQTEAHYQGLFDSRFMLGGETRGAQLAEIVRQLFNTKSERDDFYQFIRQKLNTKPMTDKVLKTRYWKGFSPKYQQQ